MEDAGQLSLIPEAGIPLAIASHEL